jgi:hypothetical protein
MNQQGCASMKHQVQFRDYRSVTGTTVRNLPDGRRLVARTDQASIVVDRDGQEFVVSSSDLMALIAVSEMPFPKSFRSAD